MKKVVPQNISCIFVTLDTFHLLPDVLSGWLKEVALGEETKRGDALIKKACGGTARPLNDFFFCYYLGAAARQRGQGRKRIIPILTFWWGSLL